MKRRATSSAGTLDSKGNLIPGKPCCSVELERKPKATAHLMLGSSFNWQLKYCCINNCYDNDNTTPIHQWNGSSPNPCSGFGQCTDEQCDEYRHNNAMGM